MKMISLFVSNDLSVQYETEKEDDRLIREPIEESIPFPRDP